MNPNNRQVAGSHYSATIQHWDYVLLALDGRYLEGNITKYVCRHRKKNGVQDLEKAMHYLEKLQSVYVAGLLKPMSTLPPVSLNVTEFISGNTLNNAEAMICMRLTQWRDAADLELVQSYIRELIKDANEEQRRRDAIKCGFSTDPGRAYVNQG